MNTTTLSLDALGWTLIHSLWQAAAAFVIVWTITRFVSTPKNRYLIFCVGVILILVSSLITFKVQLETNSIYTIQHRTESPFQLMSSINNSSLTAPFHFQNWLNENINWFVFCWMIGMVLFTIRLFNGY